MPVMLIDNIEKRIDELIDVNIVEERLTIDQWLELNHWYLTHVIEVHDELTNEYLWRMLLFISSSHILLTYDHRLIDVVVHWYSIVQYIEEYSHKSMTRILSRDSSKRYSIHVIYINHFISKQIGFFILTQSIYSLIIDRKHSSDQYTSPDWVYRVGHSSLIF